MQTGTMWWRGSNQLMQFSNNLQQTRVWISIHACKYLPVNLSYHFSIPSRKSNYGLINESVINSVFSTFTLHSKIKWSITAIAVSVFLCRIQITSFYFSDAMTKYGKMGRASNNYLRSSLWINQTTRLHVYNWCFAVIIYFVDNLIDWKFHCALIFDSFVLTHQCQNDLELMDHISLSLAIHIFFRNLIGIS